jgi:hypothetical protein
MRRDWYDEGAETRGKFLTLWDNPSSWSTLKLTTNKINMKWIFLKIQLEMQLMLSVVVDQL